MRTDIKTLFNATSHRNINAFVARCNELLADGWDIIDHGFVGAGDYFRHWAHFSKEIEVQ